MEMFFTVLAGVTVFLLSQVLLEFYVKPAVKLKNEISKVSYFTLLHQASLTNGDGTEDIQQEIRHRSAQLLSASAAAPTEDRLRRLLGLPQRGSVLKACGLLNEIGYLVFQPSPVVKTNPVSMINFNLHEIGELLGAPTAYRS